ncbi:MAG: caspase domain-containing protein [Parvibaculaceae bacterium]
MKKLLLAGTASALLALPGLQLQAEARTRMLLVGVADYNEESGIRDLLGPRNDVSIMWRLFKARGVDPKDITVLSDGVPEGADYPVLDGAATIGNIRAAFDRIASETGPEDDFVFYYSGHGTRQPDDNPEEEIEPEADGYDQVLLPADVGPYDPAGGGIKNALVDDELGRRLDQIRAKGTFVWAIIDSCHSGTVTRGDSVTRSIDPASLGVPEKGASGTANASRGGNRKGALVSKNENDLVGFYAVDAFDEAIERPFAGYNLPMVGDGKTQRMGVFTNALHHALSQGTAQTFADLAREISADLTTDRSGGRVPQPVFDGVLDRPVPGAASKGPRLITSLAADGSIAIPRGVLHGFELGSRVALYAPGKSDAPIGKAEITAAEAASSQAGNVVWEPGAAKITNGPIAVRLTEQAVSFRFAVSPPPAEDLADAAQSGTVSKAVDMAFGKDSGSSDIGITLGEPANPDGDVLLRVQNGRLWIMRPDRPLDMTAGSFGETPSFAIDGDPQVLAEKVKQAVWSLSRAEKLVRFASSLGSPADENADRPEISATIQRKGADPSTACARPDKTAPEKPLAAFAPQGVGNCDTVRFKVANETDQTYYIAAFYVDALGGVFPLSNQDRARGCVRTLYSGSGDLTYTIQINTWDARGRKPAAVGTENAVIIAIPQDATKIAPSMCSLIQPTLAAMQQTRGVEEKSATRGSAQGRSLKTLLGGITGSATRAASIQEDEEGGPAMSSALFTFDVRP